MRTQRPIGVVLAITLVATLLFFVQAQPVMANWRGNSGQAGSCAGLNMPENRDVYFSYIDPTPETSTAVSWVRNNLANPTAYDTFYVLNVDVDTHTDVLIRDRYYNSYCELEIGFDWWEGTASACAYVVCAVGLTTCDYKHAGGRCDQATVRMTNFYIDAYGVWWERNLACHEIGHALGLKHREDVEGCMPEVDPGDNRYTVHDRGHFDAFTDSAG